jgi:hypothetical protein
MPAAGRGNATQQAVTTFEASLGQTLHVDNSYSSFNWGGSLGREKWDLAHGRKPMKSWSASLMGASWVSSPT